MAKGRDANAERLPEHSAIPRYREGIVRRQHGHAEHIDFPSGRAWRKNPAERRAKASTGKRTAGRARASVYTLALLTALPPGPVGNVTNDLGRTPFAPGLMVTRREMDDTLFEASIAVTSCCLATRQQYHCNALTKQLSVKPVAVALDKHQQILSSSIWTTLVSTIGSEVARCAQGSRIVGA